MAPDTYYLWAQRVDAAPSLAALETVATGLRQLREEEDQANLFLRCTLRRVDLYVYRAATAPR
jgi:hypothetical protein